jgi:tetratricopeptide (TPR) repeat protein
MHIKVGCWMAAAWLVAAAGLSAPQAAPDAATLSAEAAYARLSRADEARESQDWERAAQLYREAWVAYTDLASTFPDWQPSVVSFRVNYCKSQIEKVMQMSASAAKTAGPAPSAEGATGRRDGEVRTIISVASQLLQQGKTAEARRALMDGVKMEPDNPSIRLLLGAAQIQAGDYRDATYVLGPLAEDFPGSGPVRLAYAAALVGLGQTAEAGEQVGKVLELSPALPEAHLDMAAVKLCEQPPDLAGAKESYEKAISLGAAPDEALELRLRPKTELRLDPAAIEQSLTPPEPLAAPAPDRQNRQ